MAQSREQPSPAQAARPERIELRWLEISRDERVLQIKEADEWRTIVAVSAAEEAAEEEKRAAPAEEEKKA